MARFREQQATPHAGLLQLRVSRGCAAVIHRYLQHCLPMHCTTASRLTRPSTCLSEQLSGSVSRVFLMDSSRQAVRYVSMVTLHGVGSLAPPNQQKSVFKDT